MTKEQLEAVEALVQDVATEVFGPNCETTWEAGYRFAVRLDGGDVYYLAERLAFEGEEPIRKRMLEIKAERDKRNG